MTTSATARMLLSIDDLTDADLRSVVTRGAHFASGEGRAEKPLSGWVAGIYFKKTSTRTRSAFSVGALRLGAQIVTYGPGDLQVNTGETVEDTGQVMSRMLDVLVARTAGPDAELLGLSGGGRLPVVNAMSAAEHPTQGLTDLTTLQLAFGRVEGLSLLYAGEGNNTAAALALALTRFPGTSLELRTPPGYGVEQRVLKRAEEQAQRYGSRIIEAHHMEDLPTGVDAIYTTRWQTTGTSKPDPGWREAFAPFQVTGALWEHSPKALFLHDLPAHRGEEVTAEVLDGPASIAFDQAENKMHSAMAVLEWIRHGAVADATGGTAEL
ncbi:ornithine carbamoyltransferase [Streptomyces sp. NPDC059832]|uniref:ornithine carbamoyltransferase n=1 Tax=unclassified Streptomyces TaxID=2593676 RepID=UPI0036507F53